MIDEMVLATQTWLNDTYTGRSGYNPLNLNNESIKGRTGWPTMYALTRALQIELNIGTPSDNFGAGTLSALANYGNIGMNQNNSNQNIVKIIQGGLFCKGYSAGGITGTFGTNTDAAVKQMKTNMGLSNPNGYVTPKVFKALLTMDAYVVIGEVTPLKEKIRSIQQWLNKRYNNRADYFFQPCDGYYSRNTQKALVYAIQYEEGLSDGVANGNFGPTTKANLPTLKLGDADGSGTQFVHLLQAALVFNNRNVSFNGVFNEDTKEKVVNFQAFTMLTADGIAGKQTWASLLVSTGDPDRRGTACDCITQITQSRANTLLANGYRTVGRYLTNVEGTSLNKKIQPGEIETILGAGMTIFPIYQTYGGSANYFNYIQGLADASAAYYAAREYGFKRGTTIYFAVDYDTMDNEITNNIIPHFRGINNRMSAFNSYYKIGIYGTRNVCIRVSGQNLAVTSFLSDMSTGFSGNLGFTLPENWAFDQISTISIGSGSGAIEIDNNIQSGRDLGVASVDAGHSRPEYLDDYYLQNEQKDSLITEISACQKELMSVFQDLKSIRSPEDAANLVYNYDSLITELSNEYKMRKALIQTVFMWEASLEGLDDIAADTLVFNYYAYKKNMEIWENLSPAEKLVVPMPTPPLVIKEDSSTGYCQIFASTAIAAYNFAIDKGIITGTKYDVSDWHDVGDVWSNLHNNPEFCIKMSALALLHAASMQGLDDNYYAYNESNIKKVIARYNGTGDAAQEYGNRNYALYKIFEKYNAKVR